MISANCFVFPKPKLADPKLIQNYLVYIPKDVKHKHFYGNHKAHDDLSCASSPTARSQSQPKSTTFRFHSISSAKERKHNLPVSAYIPCVYMKGSCYDNKLIVYFHCNGEDLISAFNFVYALNVNSGRSVLMMEYPGYSVYKRKQIKNNKSIGGEIDYHYYTQKQTTAEQIQQDAAKVIQYMKQSVGYQLKDITVLGRSIGSGPAIYVASIYPVGSLVLLSPFLSLKQAVKDLYGSFLAALLVERFNNKQRAKLIQSPCLLIHGVQDTIIPFNHSIELNKEFKSFTTLKLVQKMKHNSFHFHKQFLDHVKEFLNKVEAIHDNS